MTAATSAAMVSRSWVSADADIIRPSNVGALKLALLAIQLEDAGALARAKEFWDECETTLSEEKTNALQGHKRVQPQAPWGVGVDPEPNIM